MRTAMKNPTRSSSSATIPPKKETRRGRKRKADENLDDVWRIYKKTKDENIRNVLIENCRKKSV